MSSIHPKTAAQIAALESNPTGSVLWYGAPVADQLLVAKSLAGRLGCRFPDLIVVERTDKASLGIEQVRSLITELGLRPYSPGQIRIAIIPEAHLLTTEAQNALLKLLEEPPPSTLILLLTGQLEALLPTVRSRCRQVQFIVPAPVPEMSLPFPGSISLFERLILVGKLSLSATALAECGADLHRRITAAVRSGEVQATDASRWLEALERFRQHLQAKVTPRVALESLMLELN
jgi:hypothetical protein